jgi:hypothetical protein
MDTIRAMASADASRVNPSKVFDWDKAAKIIRERKPNWANAGLHGDWEYTGGPIWANGAIVPEEDTYTYLSSTWATPELEIDGVFTDCWTYTNEWDAGTYWPDSARQIIGGS